jgi:vancomycin permeability regulator SanA
MRPEGILRHWKTWLLIVALLSLILILPRRYIVARYAARIHAVESAPSRPVAIVFGAGLRWDGRPSRVLMDRVRVAVDLYQRGRVEKVLLSGSVGPAEYNEPEGMRAVALDLGVPERDLWLDFGGSSTLETCLRARWEFGVLDAVLVSQRFHLPRALAICDALGIEAVGAQADLSRYGIHAQRWWALREFPATLVALWDAARIRLGFGPLTAETPNHTLSWRCHGPASSLGDRKGVREQ